MESRDNKKILVSNPKEKKKLMVTVLIISLLFVAATMFSKFNPINALLAQKEFWRFIVVDFCPPQFKNWNMLWEATIQTLFMAMSATGVSAVIAFGLAFLGSPSICKIKWVNRGIRGFASVLRNIPALVWAFVLVAAFGIGTAVGILALIISTVGFLIRSFIETLDEVAEENMEALRSTGAGILPVIAQSIIPAAMPGFITWFLYCIEVNIRSSAILGMVGAGGIGLLMMSYIKQYNYHGAATVILAIAIIIIAVNLLTNYLRKITIQ